MGDRESSTDIHELLSAPFPADVIGWKPQAVSKDGAKALAVPYIDARDVMNRLDEVFGAGGWSTSYVELSDGSMLCSLQCRVGGALVLKSDVGGLSSQPDDGDRKKAACSDALKRAAVQWGIGRYLYSVPHNWVAYDAQHKRFKEQPQLPGWALPLAVTPFESEELTDALRKAGKEVWEEFKHRYQVGRCGELPRMHLADARQWLAGKKQENSTTNPSAA